MFTGNDYVELEGTDEGMLEQATCGDCGRWLFAWRVRQKLHTEHCLCNRGKLRRQVEEMAPLKALPVGMTVRMRRNELMKDGYKCNQLFSMTGFTAPSGGLQGKNHPRFNAAMRAKGMQL